MISDTAGQHMVKPTCLGGSSRDFSRLNKFIRQRMVVRHLMQFAGSQQIQPGVTNVSHHSLFADDQQQG